ncbi:hypothetical protein D9611_011867 [Ephemerocybe angulata]|uniref:ATP-dependent DNA helicase n=1 Tax=Ephemerocybe angulata TaxID=980116 RepID=A0A8H5BY44_9AGAR|nr:hypothetical protein D9611_011867 [Tulosesus angulatus]
MQDIVIAMKGYCSQLTPAIIDESGCCVCGQLTRRADLVPLDESLYDMTLLEELGCTRMERTSMSESILGVKGAVLDPTVKDICATCHLSLKRGHRPKMALANRLWLGQVPKCLQDLTLGECALIARVRYNRVIVRVAKGHAKMIANVISFEHPSKKIYERLPVSKPELSEVLSILYTGMEPPSDDDLKRTPVLVRRNKVKEALEWLKLNHRNYADLSIDYDTLDTYDLDEIPIGLLRKDIPEADGNVLAAAKSVFDSEYELGTEDGPCPFVVNGLTSERHGEMTTSQRKVAALQHLKNGGYSLAIGHESKPQSMYNNPSLYPQMYPWLFPYGYGGVGQDEHSSFLSRDLHIKWLLMYHDKRFQEDAGFLIVALNHTLIQQSSKGSFISMKRNNFGRAAEAIDKLDPGVLLSISERLRDGGRFFPKTPEEKKCATLMDQLDVVGGHVAGSLARKKYQRGEIWSLINYLNSPAWFITISPADSKHPLCVHWASHDIEFKPEIKGYKERLNLITRNPVACARFFHHLVLLFIKYICGWSEEEVKRGLFGVPSAFYGTVEQQGRMTLHLHFLLWIRGQLPLHIVREKIMAEDSEFIRALTEYIESALIGEFMTGSKDEVVAQVPRIPEYDDRGIHTILQDTTGVPEGYVDPTLSMPEAPPDVFCDKVETCDCIKCAEVHSWYERFKMTVDDILLRSNVHTCFGRKDNKKKADQAKEKEGSIPKVHATGKGCINKDGVCTARFPREVFMNSSVDVKTGHLNVKKRESSINDVNPAVVATNRCNTDARCLLSGTSVKAIVGYVTDYITKGWLKTHQVFQATYDSFVKNEKVLDKTNEQRPGNGARQMIMKVVNSLSSKMEIGAPMAALYLLQNPDHYTSHEFVPFYWKNYLNYVQAQWKALTDMAEPGEYDIDTLPEDVGIVRNGEAFEDPWMGVTHQTVFEELGYGLQEDMGPKPGLQETDADDDVIFLHMNPAKDGKEVDVDVVKHEDEENAPRESHGDSSEDDDFPMGGALEECQETVQMSRSNGHYMAKSNTDDYRHRPTQMEEVSLYDYVQCALKHPIRAVRNPRQDLRWFRLSEEHPQYATHAVALDPGRRQKYVPHFIGPPIPRRDAGDREYYCCAMLTLFRPWRTGIDMKSADVTWEAAFDAYSFTERQKEIMANFNMRYECYDARDDYSAIIKAAGLKADPLATGDDDEEEEDDIYVENGENDEDDDDLCMGIGKDNTNLRTANSAMLKALRSAGWKATSGASRLKDALKLPRIAIDNSLRSGAWNNILKVEKLRAWRRKLGAMVNASKEDIQQEDKRPRGEPRNDAYVVSAAFLSKDFKPSEEKWSEVMKTVIDRFSLNDGQQKAFRIIANHACAIDPMQLLMHLGGMGGTGKSTVIKALCHFFSQRDENYRFVLLGPTGTSAALIGGSTYHTFLGINSDRSGKRGDTSAKIEEVRERLTGVGYVLIDEHSMLDCRALCAISARCCECVGVFEKPFGGLNVILSGDFAQLPPVTGYTLYSRNVEMQQTARQTVWEQECTIGKHIWLQFTTVVILTENMRQTDSGPTEVAFRKALENLRWKSCTDEDIALLRSRIAGSSPELSVDAERFKDVSIITALNRDKDLINATSSARFAAENGQQLEDFYSTDTLSSAEPRRFNPKKPRRVYSTARVLSKSMQVNLWNQPPSTSEQIPGKLSLCIGMPVIIRHNEATELCITRGQEARVVGWSALKYPKWRGRKYLDVLYVELVNPPHPVNLPHLPKNVVPLTRHTESIEAQLSNDLYIRISRSQIPVLPNFAMTDYSSQGKTRPANVVDISECRSFQGVYTCLSRGTSLEGTLIVRDFSNDLLQGELDGSLRQEYRELQYLTTITDLRYNGILPPEIFQMTRWETIKMYRLWKETAGRTVTDAPTLPKRDDLQPPKENITYHSQTLASVNKRKEKEEKDKLAPPKKKRKTRPVEPILANASWASPPGPPWDSEDWSCAYDVWTFILHGLWVSDRVRWSRILKGFSPALVSLLSAFEGMNRHDPEGELTKARNHLRDTMRQLNPAHYPRGRQGVDIMQLTQDLLGYRFRGLGIMTKCSTCERRDSEYATTPSTIAPFSSVRRAMSIQDFVDENLRPRRPCDKCGGDVFIRHKHSDLLCFEFVHAEDDLLLNTRIQIGEWGSYRLVGIVYYGENHFISRVITREDKVYSHDGMDGVHSTYEGILDERWSSNDRNICNEKRGSLAIYALADRTSYRNASDTESDHTTAG